MHQSSAVSEDGSVSEVFDIGNSGHGLEALTGLCQKVCDLFRTPFITEHETKFQLFSEVNSILYGESYIYLLHSLITEPQ